MSDAPKTGTCRFSGSTGFRRRFLVCVSLALHLVAAGLNGTQMAPTRRIARNATGNSVQLGNSKQTRCSSSRPSSRNDLAQLWTCSTSCEYVYCLPSTSSICEQPRILHMHNPHTYYTSRLYHSLEWYTRA